ncbi:MAG: putative lipoprotein, partial [Herminiimonas sp.]|nr:putative lipoprotein [Herminiimonas sp.]
DPPAMLTANEPVAQAHDGEPGDDAAEAVSAAALEPFAAESLAVPTPLVEQREWNDQNTADAVAFEKRESLPVSDDILAGTASRNPVAVAPDAAPAPAPANESKVVAFGGQELIAASDGALENTRGGFDTGNGLLVSFGITRVAYINGNLATTTSFNIADVGKVTPEQASALSKQLGSVNLVQNGAGNSFQPALTSSSGTVIQNTLSNQTIMTRTVIDASANSSGLLRNLNTQRTLTEALGSALRR